MRWWRCAWLIGGAGPSFTLFSSLPDPTQLWGSKYTDYLLWGLKYTIKACKYDIGRGSNAYNLSI